MNDVEPVSISELFELWQDVRRDLAVLEQGDDRTEAESECTEAEREHLIDMEAAVANSMLCQPAQAWTDVLAKARLIKAWVLDGNLRRPETIAACYRRDDKDLSEFAATSIAGDLERLVAGGHGPPGGFSREDGGGPHRGRHLRIV